MTCSTGVWHTITVSDDGCVFAFGANSCGQLGLGNFCSTLTPIQIRNLPKIKQVSCGSKFTFCLDEEGFLWSFGANGHGQLGIGNLNKELNLLQKIRGNNEKYANSMGRNTTIANTTPQRIVNIPPVYSISCGFYHTLILTNDSKLWSCGSNKFGQLALRHTERQFTPQLTSFANIINISAGGLFSLFQNTNGEIYGCGFNASGELGLGNNVSPQIEPICILNQPPNIVQFRCGYNHAIFLDMEGNVFSVGNNDKGSLGLGSISNQNMLNQILDIPPIHTISCTSYGTFLLDFDGNVWACGLHDHSWWMPLKDEDIIHCAPTKIPDIKQTQQISSGFGSKLYSKDSQHAIFVTNTFNAGTVIQIKSTFLKWKNPDTIWGSSINLKIRAKSARK